MLGANGLRTVFQAVGFILVARLLGVRGFGAFASVVALVSIFVPFAGYGGGQLLIRDVARDPETLAERWRTALWAAVISGGILWMIAVGIAALALPRSIPLGLVVCVASADLLLGGFLLASSMAYQGVGRMRRTAQINTLPSLLKFIGVIGLWLLPVAPGPMALGVVYLAAAVIAAIVALLMVRLELHRPAARPRKQPYPAREAFYFCAGLATRNLYNDLDKTMLARLSTLEATGTYAAAYRIIEMAYLPVMSMFTATYASFFRVGASGLRGCIGLARKLMPASLGYAAVASILVYLCAPLFPYLTGEQYAASVQATRWLALIPVIRAVHHFAADSLTGAGYQPHRTRIQGFVAAANFAVNLWLIPAYGWLGAAWASLLCDGALVFLLWGTVGLLLQRERHAKAMTMAITAPATNDLDEPGFSAREKQTAPVTLAGMSSPRASRRQGSPS